MDALARVQTARIVVRARALRLGVAFAGAIALLGASGAAAQPVIPPDNSAANQYTEALPGWKGNEPTGRLGGEGADPEKSLGKRNAAKLEALGPEGAAAAELAALTAPEGVGSDGKGREGGGAAGNAPTPFESGPSAPRQLFSQITGISDSGGMGSLLPLIIALTTIAAAFYALSRRRTTRSPT